MKTMYYFFLVILSFLFLSCNNENTNYSALYFMTSLPKQQIKTVLKSSVSEEDSLFTGTLEPPKGTVLEFCTGEDLEWYNETTGELKFKEIETKNTIILNLIVYLDNKFLFGLRLIPNVMSSVINIPVLVQDLNNNGHYYIAKGYPNWDLNEYDIDTKMKIERENNWNTLIQSEGWKLFIQQLKKEGRYRK